VGLESPVRDEQLAYGVGPVNGIGTLTMDQTWVIGLDFQRSAHTFHRTKLDRFLQNVAASPDRGYILQSSVMRKSDFADKTPFLDDMRVCTDSI
jgi:hypothetical protein